MIKMTKEEQATQEKYIAKYMKDVPEYTERDEVRDSKLLARRVARKEQKSQHQLTELIKETEQGIELKRKTLKDLQFKIESDIEMARALRLQKMQDFKKSRKGVW